MVLMCLVTITSVWKPLHDDIKPWPLAVSYGSRIHAEESIAVDQVMRHSRGEGYVMRYRPWLEWYHLSNMTRDEALLILPKSRPNVSQSPIFPSPRQS